MLLKAWAQCCSITVSFCPGAAKRILLRAAKKRTDLGPQQAHASLVDEFPSSSTKLYLILPFKDLTFRLLDQGILGIVAQLNHGLAIILAPG